MTWRAGVPILRAAVEQSPDQSEIRLHLGTALVHAGENLEAREVLVPLLKQGPDSPYRTEARAACSGWSEPAKCRRSIPARQTLESLFPTRSTRKRREPIHPSDDCRRASTSRSPGSDSV